MKTIAAWFRKHNISTHGVALAITGLAVLVETDSHIRDILLKDLEIHPKIISSLAALGAIVLAYKQPGKQGDAQAARDQLEAARTPLGGVPKKP